MDPNHRILIIDDDKGVRDTYQSILTPEAESDVLSQGQRLFGGPRPVRLQAPPIRYDLSLASDGVRGIAMATDAKAQNQPFAVAFIDMKMPKIDGAVTAQKIWEIDPDIKIVIVTAYSEYTPADIIEVTGRDDLFYLRKPFNHEEIHQFARALTYEWNLERRRDSLETDLTKANADLANLNENLKEKIQKQTAMIIQAEKMASIGILAAGVAHEINNPISYVRSNLSTAKRYFKQMTALYEHFTRIESFLSTLTATPAKQLLDALSIFKEENDIQMIIDDLEDLANESISGIDRVKSIVSDLKSFSRADDSGFAPVDINQAIRSSLPLIDTGIGKHAKVDLQLEDLPPIRCNAKKIGQVVMNLLINAEQAIETEGTITVATRMLCFGKRKTDRFVEISVSDTGCGIPEEHLSKLFDPFFTTKPVGKGTGLGLSIAYEIVKFHNGKIFAENLPGKGCRFSVLLPAFCEASI